ncbi:MAG: hypothetical protein ACO3JL_21035, partial [Myxococcota bacterium]
MPRNRDRWRALCLLLLCAAPGPAAAAQERVAPAVPQRVRPIEAQLHDDLETLALESGIARLPHALPASDAELAALLTLIDEGRLTAAGKRTLARVKAELAAPAGFSLEGAGVDVALVLQPEGNWRSSERHPFRRDYARRPSLLRVPLALSFGPHVYAVVEPAWKQDPNAVSLQGQSGLNVLDLARNPLETDTHFPFRAFLSAGGDRWRFTLGRDRLSLGNAGDDNLILSSNVPF